MDVIEGDISVLRGRLLHIAGSSHVAGWSKASFALQEAPRVQQCSGNLPHLQPHQPEEC